MVEWADRLSKEVDTTTIADHLDNDGMQPEPTIVLKSLEEKRGSVMTILLTSAVAMRLLSRRPLLAMKLNLGKHLLHVENLTTSVLCIGAVLFTVGGQKYLQHLPGLDVVDDWCRSLFNLSRSSAKAELHRAVTNGSNFGKFWITELDRRNGSGSFANSTNLWS